MYTQIGRNRQNTEFDFVLSPDYTISVVEKKKRL